MEIAYASSDEERREVRDFLAKHIDDIAETAVPAPSMDYAFKPLVPLIRGEDGQIVAAALTCRALLAGSAVITGRAEQMFGTALDRHSELDLLAVAEGARGDGLGTRLVHDLESKLAAQGVRVWFGNVTAGNDVERLRAFYSRLGFTVLADGQPLPPLLGRQWAPPLTEEPVFVFYKKLARQS
ncbi:GNAT family N-acetyltransferase [Nocardioides zeicaulis]|uniref:GNAT family N-acetyltransferase n=1 Tax=Nocardioides zeicaulis TaxID=1776857 RepID=A0ABV6E1I7_9ACTN